MKKQKTILIVGGSGFIGSHIAFSLREHHKVFATYHKNQVQIPGVTSLPVNVTEEAYVKRLVYLIHPEVVIYVAGTADVEWAENNSRSTNHLHVGGATNVQIAADVFKPKLILISSSYIFDGKKGNYHEDEIAFPISSLGKSLSGAENIIRSRSINYLIVRASPLYGRGNGINNSFIEKIRIKLERKEPMELPTDMKHSFASADGFVDFITTLVESPIRNKILHYGGLTKMTFYEFATEFAQRFDYDSKLIMETQQTTKQLFERTLFDYSLNFTETAKLLKFKPLLLEEGFDLLEKQLTARA